MTRLVRVLERWHAHRTRRSNARNAAAMAAWERELVTKYGAMFTPSRTAVTTKGTRNA